MTTRSTGRAGRRAWRARERETHISTIAAKAVRRTFRVLRALVLVCTLASTELFLCGVAASAAPVEFAAPSGHRRTFAVSPDAVQSPRNRDLPRVTLIPADAGVHGMPYDAVPTAQIVPGAPPIDLAAAGYTQREFLLSGTATEYTEAGLWESDGTWNVKTSRSGVPYTTRLLVRYPLNPSAFNGTVVVEWLNDSTGSDQDPVWAQVHNELLDNGFAYAGVTVQRAGMADLRAWDPARYGSLGDASDAQSYDIFSQVARLLRTDSAAVMGGLVTKDVVGVGDSQSAMRIETYVNAIQPVSHAYNGFIAIGRSGSDAPIGDGLFMLSPFPAYVRTDNTTPFIQINTQGDIAELAAGSSDQPDNAGLRTWDVSGASHIDFHEATYELETIYREQPNISFPACINGTPFRLPRTHITGLRRPDTMPLYQIEDAAVADMQLWLTEGIPAPSEPSHERIISFGPFYSIPTNRYGLASGGVQLPEAQVPTAVYSVVNRAAPTLSVMLSAFGAFPSFLGFAMTGSLSTRNTAARTMGLCALTGSSVPLPRSVLRRLYPTHADYVRKFTAAAHADEAAGFLTPADAAADIASAEASSVP